MLFLYSLLAVCIMNQFVLTSSSHPGHDAGISGFEKCGDISSASGGFFFSHLCAMLNGFPAGSNPRAKYICCSRLKECIRVSREHPMITRSDQWLLSHHTPGWLFVQFWCVHGRRCCGFPKGQETISEILPLSRLPTCMPLIQFLMGFGRGHVWQTTK